MSVLRLMAAALLVIGAGVAVRAEEKADVSKLLGAWEVVKTDESGPPAGAIIEFAKDGKMKVTHKVDGKDMVIDGSYVLEGAKLSVTLKHDGKEDKHTVTIKKLTDTDLTIENEKGKTAELKKK